MKVTIFESIYLTNNPSYITVGQALRRIQNGSSQKTIEVVRGGDKNAKKKLPIVLFSGQFSERSDDKLFDHSGFIVLDFDHVADGDEQGLAQTKSVLATDQYSYATWISPSGDGIKLLVRITNPERHRDHFRALQVYFSKQYGVTPDPSGLNESRACFESYDPDIVVNEGASKFGAFLSNEVPNQSAVNKDKYTDYMKLNLAAKMIRVADDGAKHAGLLKAARLCGGYISAGRMEEDEVIRVLHREICKREIESEAQALVTIRDGIELGKKDPIKTVVSNEKSAQREMLLNDGDMSFISSDDEDFRWIDSYANGNIEVGLDTGDQELDKYFRYKKEFVVINGHSNVGKTTMALYMMVNSTVRHGWKWVVYSSENRTSSLKMSLMQFGFNKRVNEMTYDQRKAAYKWVQEHFTVISNNQVYSYSDIIIFLEKVIRNQPVDAVFVDPYNSLKLDMAGSNIGVHDYHYEAASEFLTFSKANNIAVWLNMHAVTEAQRRKGDDGLPVAPYAEDTEGGGKFVNRADCFLTIHRKVQAPDPNVRKTTEFHVRKVRETETGGEPSPIDAPITFTMNVPKTAFRVNSTGRELFQPAGLEFDMYRQFN